MMNMSRNIVRGMRVERECHCEACGYDWVSRVANPKQCPYCRRFNWQTVKVTQLEDGRYVDGAGNEIPRELVEGADV